MNKPSHSSVKPHPCNEPATRVFLAPMEGVVDATMRELLTSINDYDLCVTEFIRVVDDLVPAHIFYKIAPELRHQGLTKSGTPIRLQLLGQNAPAMAENALRAIELGSHGVDINFGCPAKAVNKSKGGAVLLKSPELIYQIVSAVKQAVGGASPTSVKIRLGFDNVNLLDEIVDAIVSAGADLLTVHARTKADGYRPPAYWHYIGEIEKKHHIELVANGEIWSRTQAFQCQQASGTHNLMVGRGALALPNIANVIKHNEAPLPWAELIPLFHRYSELELAGDKSFYFSSRIKQWCRYLKLQYPQAETFFEKIKRVEKKQQMLAQLSTLV